TLFPYTTLFRSTGRRADIQNRTASSCDHLRKQTPREQCERDDIYLNDPIVSLRIARGKRPVVAQSGIVDQEVDVDLVLIEPRDQIVDLRLAAKIDSPHMNIQLGVSIAKFVAQFIQSLLASRDENERSRACRQLSRKFEPDSGGSTGDERVRSVNFHFFAALRATPTVLRQ